MGALPQSMAARFTRAPPTEGGSKTPPMVARSMYQRTMDGQQALAMVRVGGSMQLLHRLAYGEGRGISGHGLAEACGDAVGNFARPLPHEAPALEAEDASPNAI